MSYAQAMRHRPHKLNMGHTFNPSGIQYAAPRAREYEPRVYCPGPCGKKYARSTVSWVIVGLEGPSMCKRCNSKREASR